MQPLVVPFYTALKTVGLYWHALLVIVYSHAWLYLFIYCLYCRWEANSYGYHGDDGLLYHGQGKGDTFGPTYIANDIVGAGINYASQEFFFTWDICLQPSVYLLLESMKLYIFLCQHFTRKKWKYHWIYFGSWYPIAKGFWLLYVLSLQ